MNYEKKYKEALKRARNLYNSEETSADVEIACEKIFPELVESEDERIRKALIEYFGEQCDMSDWNGVYGYQVLSWLEKQGEKKETLCDKCRKEQPSHSCQDITALGRCALENKYFASQENAGSDMTNGLTYKQSKCSTCINDKGCINCENGNQYETYAEKVDNQNCVKTTDKVEPKFKVGDWVIEPREGELNGLWHIEKIEDNNYWEGRTGVPIEYADKYYRLWTIQDAKDGDVLVHSSFMFGDFIFIYNNTSILQAYCYYSNKRNRFIVEDRGHHCPWNMQEVTPATKEQRDLLFQKMKEAGYEWDAEKKELRDIKQKPDGKVKPKFHKGEWIISDTANKDYSICKIIDVKDGNYTIESIYGYKDYNQFNEFDNTYRLWTIRDAKPGDVLVNNNKTIFIFKEIEYDAIIRSGVIRYFIRQSFNGLNFPLNNGGHLGVVDKNLYIHPATKEQRDTLMKAMTDDGYTFDFEKKELKEIEQKQEDERIKEELTDFESALFTAFSDAWQQYLLGEDVDTVQWVKEHSSELLKIAKQNNESSWSEEDEHRIKDTIYFLETAKKHYASTIELDACIEWFKSLKERMKGE